VPGKGGELGEKNVACFGGKKKKNDRRGGGVDGKEWNLQKRDVEVPSAPRRRGKGQKKGRGEEERSKGKREVQKKKRSVQGV